MPSHELRPDNWIDNFADQMLGYAAIRLPDREIAKDLVQESFFVALRSKDSFRGEISEKNWLFLILKSRILDYYKKKKEVLESELTTLNDEEPIKNFTDQGHWIKEEAPMNWSPDKMMESSEFMKVLNDCRKRLSELQQAVFTLKFMNDEESENICKELGISSSNYWVVVHRAKIQLRKCLEINWMT